MSMLMISLYDNHHTLMINITKILYMVSKKKEIIQILSGILNKPQRKMSDWVIVV